MILDDDGNDTVMNVPQLIEEYEDLTAIDLPRVLRWVEKNLQAHLSDFRRVLYDGKLAGFFCLTEGELDSLFVLPEFRGKGYGKGLLKQLAKITVERGCGRLEWYCLDWNQPSIDFYRSFGAVALDDWTTYRLSGDTLKKMAE